MVVDMIAWSALPEQQPHTDAHIKMRFLLPTYSQLGYSNLVLYLVARCLT